MLGDNPIGGPSDDQLNRDEVARHFVGQIMALDQSQGLVVGVMGPWGSGKSSFLNLVRPRLESSGAVILRFNPWMFSGAQQLVESFFVELASQLKTRRGMAEIGQLIEDYGEIFSGWSWIPIAGPWISRSRDATKLVGRLLQRRKEGISGRQAKLRQALIEAPQPIVVILDDIDRLSTAEIRDVFKLVRLTASFPNVVYILAFDRERVEAALSEDNVPGREYLEKILQVSMDLPFVPSEVLLRQTTMALDEVLGDVDWVSDEDQAAWPDVLSEVIFPLIRHMRDVRRFAVSAQGAVSALGGRVALSDLLALDAIRLFLPEVFSKLHSSAHVLTSVSSGFDSGSEDSLVEALVAAAGDKAEIVRSAITRLFPAAAGRVGGTSHGADWLPVWLRAKRVAHRDILLLYLERVAGPSLTVHGSSEIAWGLMADAMSFDAYLHQIEPEKLQDVVAGLETFERDYKPEQVVPGTTVLLNLVSDIQEGTLGMFEVGKSMIVRRVVLRLLKSLGDESEIEKAADQVFPELTSLSAQWSLISLVGHREDEGHSLVSKSASELYEWAWRRQVVAADPKDLAREEDLLRILVVASAGLAEEGGQLVVKDDRDLTVALIRSARSEIRRQSMGSRTVRRTPTLAWEALTSLLGDEAELVRRATVSLKEAGEMELLALVEKYAGGWRPESF